MNEIAIQVENLSKRYRIGVQEKRHNTFGAAIAALALQPFRNLKRLRRLSSFSDDEEQRDDVIWALSDINFEVSQGERIGVIGRNGAGKSTLLKILARITEPTGGQAMIRGRVSSLLEVGTGFHPELTGRENVYLNASILGMRRAEIGQKFDAIVDFSGVEKFIDTPVKRYSSGMRVRLAFAVAAFIEPEVLIIDEVLAVGDAEFQQKSLGRMSELTGEGRTVMFVSHNMAAINQLTQRCILLDRGRIQSIGPTVEVVEAYSELTKRISGEDLPSRKDRTGDGLVRVTGVWAENRDGARIPAISVGDPIDLVVAYRCDDPAAIIGTVICTIQIQTAYDPNICILSSYVMNSKLSLNSGEGQWRCSIGSLPLAPGRYTLDVYISSPGAIHDRIRDVEGFVVEDSDYFGTGRTPKKSSAGVFYLRHRWGDD